MESAIFLKLWIVSALSFYWLRGEGGKRLVPKEKGQLLGGGFEAWLGTALQKEKEEMFGEDE